MECESKRATCLCLFCALSKKMQGHEGTVDPHQTSSHCTHAHSTVAGTSAGCRDHPLAEIGACGAVMTGAPPLHFLLQSSCSRGHCGVAVGAVLVSRVRFLCEPETLYSTVAQSLTKCNPSTLNVNLEIM